MHDQLFETVDSWADGEAETIFIALAEELALDMDRFNICFNSRQAMEGILRDLYEGQDVRRGPIFLDSANGRTRSVTSFAKQLPANISY